MGWLSDPAAQAVAGAGPVCPRPVREAGAVGMVAPARIRVHHRNIRRDLGDLSGLVESVRRDGVRAETMTVLDEHRPSGPAGAGIGAPGVDFRYRAACRSVDPEVFFPTAVRGAVFAVQVAAAKAVCAGCPVQAECLTWALTALSDGIAGGMTDQERRGELARRRGASPRRVPRRPVGGTPAEVTAAGRAAVAAGMSVGEAVREFGVSTRTADRWVRAARIRPTHEITAAPVAVAGLDGAA